MSLTETNLFEVTKTQYFYKVKAYSDFLSILIVVQILSIAASMGGIGMSGSSGDGVDIAVHRYSSTMVILFTIAWAFYCSIICSTQTYKNIDFVYVSNRLSSSLSTIGFLLTAGSVAGITSTLSGVLLRIIVFLTQGSQNLSDAYFFISPFDLLAGMAATILYITLFTSIGFFIGSLFQFNKLLIILIPPAFVLAERFQSIRDITINAFAQETSLIFFTIKVFCASALLFSTATLLSNQLEVRR